MQARNFKVKIMKKFSIIAALIVFSLISFAQENIKPEDKSLFNQLSKDKTFKPIRLNNPLYLNLNNIFKQELYNAFLNKTSGSIKVFKNEQVGMEGQYTMTYFTVNNSKVKIVEAYFGDPSGSKELKFIHVYTPETIQLGYLDKDWHFVTVSNGEISKDKELFIGYFVNSEQKIRRF